MIRRLLVSSKSDAIIIKAKAQKTLSFFDRLISFLIWKISLRVEDESALIDELRVDIAADIIPAISIPLTPIGKNVAMKSGWDER